MKMKLSAKIVELSDVKDVTKHVKTHSDTTLLFALIQ